VNVALLQLRITPEWGGAWTFQQTLLRAIRALEQGSPHRFSSYDLNSNRRAILRRARVRAVRHLQDDVLEVPRRWARSTALERHMDQQGIDLVWFTTPFAVEVNRPYVFTIWDLEHLTQPWYPEVSRNGEWELRDRFYRRVIEQATALIVPNPAARDLVCRAYTIGPERVLCLTHPLSEFALAAAKRPPASTAILERHGIRRPYLFYPAQFWAHKDHPTLLDALVQLPEYDLVLVGSDKGQADRVRAGVAQRGLGDRVHFPGFVEEDELVALYQNAHALTYASMFGPENLPPLEAFALGCPVVVADVPGAREQLGDAALRVAPMDAAAVVEAVRALAHPATRERHIAVGRDRATRGTADDYVQGVFDFLDRFQLVVRSWA
jgi:glycosyltransferase involved in cell wall biosynthesis